MTPNLFAWYSMVSKFKPEVRKSWPKGKATAPAQQEESKGATDTKEKGRGRQGDKGKKNAPKGGKKE